MFIVDLKRILLRWARILHDLDIRARHSGFDPRFDLLQTFHSLGAFDRRRTKYVWIRRWLEIVLSKCGHGEFAWLL